MKDRAYIEYIKNSCSPIGKKPVILDSFGTGTSSPYRCKLTMLELAKTVGQKFIASLASSLNQRNEVFFEGDYYPNCFKMSSKVIATLKKLISFSITPSTKASGQLAPLVINNLTGSFTGRKSIVFFSCFL